MSTAFRYYRKFLAVPGEYIRRNVNVSTESLWNAGRIMLALGVTISTLLLLEERPIRDIFLALMGFIVVYTLALAWLVKHRMVVHAFVIGFVLDNISIFVGWYSFLQSTEGASQTNDLYLIVIPVVIMAFVRLGWFLGGAYTAIWLGWLAWSSLHYYAPGSYDVEQLPVRVIFIALTAVLVARMVASIDDQRSHEQARMGQLEEIQKLRSDLVKPCPTN